MNVLIDSRNKINRVVHIADIHIRLTKRYEEYQKVFSEFKSELTKLVDGHTILVIAGDVFHNKSDLSPECVQLGVTFLKDCANIMPTILTAGNHDATLTNKNRLDSLSPIVNAIKHDNLYYLRDSGLYQYENIMFNNYSVFDDITDDYIKYEDIKDSYKLKTDHHIALFHGPVNNSMTDMGFVINNRSTMVDMFDGHHMVMLGDIHKHQILQQYDEELELPTVAYAGSMLQQNHSEALKGHGYLLWNLDSKTFKHYPLKNECGFYTIEIEDGKLISDLDDIPNNVRLRAKCKKSTQSQVKDIIRSIKDKVGVLETTYIKVYDQDELDAHSNQHIIEVHNISDIEYQNKLIEEELVRRNTSPELISAVKQINININNRLSKEIASKNIRWKPKLFTFENMFSYGENNVIDFSKLNGAVGLFAENASGKSSVFDALAFCIFDKFSRGYKASHVLNAQKMTFKCMFNFEINGIDFFIERTGKSDKHGTVKVNVNFWKEENGVKTELNGEARRNTNDIIRDYLGTYEDFILTVLSVQNNKAGSFIDLGQTERKDMLCQFMGLNIFDNLYTVANDHFKETNAMLKTYSKDELTSNMDAISGSIVIINDNINTEKECITEFETTKNEWSQRIIDLSEKIINLPENIVDITKLEKDKTKESNKISILKQEISDIEVSISKNEDKMRNMKIPADDVIDALTKEYEFQIKLDQDIKNKKQEIDKLKSYISVQIDKLKKLEEHEYDPNCEFCINNVFVRDAIQTKETLEGEKAHIKEVMDSYNDLNLQVNMDIEKRYSNLKSLISTHDKIKSNVSNLKHLQLGKEKELLQCQQTIDSLSTKIENYYSNIEIIEKNKSIISEISDFKSKIKSLDNSIKSHNDKLFQLNNTLGQHEVNYKVSEANLTKVIELEDSYHAYKLYTELVCRDGIPYNIIKNTIPEIEKEINNILQQMVDFTVRLETDGKNIITNIVYDDKIWPLEMSSGIERFLSGIAIRVALINISNLPRPNIFCVDEGFGCADSNHLCQMGSLFNYLKQQFDFIWIISHLDQLRDMVDIHLEITKHNGFSNIYHP